MGELHATDALIVPRDFVLAPGALRVGVATNADLSAMRRYVKLAEKLRSCRYFTQEERNFHVTMDKGVTTSWQQTLPGAGATRDMLGLLRQLFGDKERASFEAMTALLRRLADSGATEGQQLLQVVERFKLTKQGVLDSWDSQPGGRDVSPHPPLTVFLDWMYGEYLHSDPEKARRIQELDTEFRLYEWQFHWVSDRLAAVFVNFAPVVRSALGELGGQG